MSTRERKGHRKLRLCSKKNYERKRTAAKHQRLRTESQQLSLQCCIPISFYFDQTVSTIDILRDRLQKAETAYQGLACQLYSTYTQCYHTYRLDNYIQRWKSFILPI